MRLSGSTASSSRLERRAGEIATAFGGTWGGAKGMCRCPAHDDLSPSLAIGLGDHAILFHCFAGCSSTSLGKKPQVRFLPAMLAAVRTDEAIVAVHRTFLDTRSDHVRVSRIAASDGRSLLGREVSAIHVPDLAKALRIDIALEMGADEPTGLVVKSGKAMPLRSVEPLIVKRALVNANQRIELTGWSPVRLDWYKAQGCFTEIIRYWTRLFVPVSEAAAILARLRR